MLLDHISKWIPTFCFLSWFWFGGFLFGWLFSFLPCFLWLLCCFCGENDSIFHHYIHITIWQISFLYLHFNTLTFKCDLCLSDRHYSFSHLIFLILLPTFATNLLNLAHKCISLGKETGGCLCVPICKHKCTKKHKYVCKPWLVGACVVQVPASLCYLIVMGFTLCLPEDKFWLCL